VFPTIVALDNVFLLPTASVSNNSGVG
jgi:hypothetical protein